MSLTATEAEEEKKIVTTPAEAEATGRRKTAVARVKLKPGTGEAKINGNEISDYFTTAAMKTIALRPLVETELLKKFDIEVKCRGGGLMGQAGAVSLGIARALNKVNAELRPSLKKVGLLTRDPRERERKKTGQPGARKRFQFSKR